MNIDKIYKPLSLCRNDEGIPYYDTLEVEELEERYKELLKEHVNLVKGLIEDFYCDGTDYECIPLCEKLTGMKWEDIIK